MTDAAPLIQTLRMLAQLDVDAVLAYDQAIKRIDVVGIALKLESFRADHERHIENLAVLIRSRTGEAPPLARDFKGYVIEGFTAVMSVLGTREALLAMKQNELLTNRRYADAFAAGLPEDERRVIRKHYDDEQRHLAYMNMVLRDRVWDVAKDESELAAGVVPPLGDLGTAPT